MLSHDLIYDWNPPQPDLRVALLDATLAESARSTHLPVATCDGCLAHLRHLASMGVETVEFPDCATALALLKAARAEGLKLRPAFWGEETIDLSQALDLSRELDVPVEVFLTPDRFGTLGESARNPALRFGLILENPARRNPATLAGLLRSAADQGVETIAFHEDEGFATLDEVRHVVSFAVRLLRDWESHATVLWSCSNAGELAIACALAAGEAGATRVRGAALGLGDTGLVPLDLMLVNLALSSPDARVEGLKSFCLDASRTFGVEIPSDYPVFGRDAFRTATGVHAAAIVKSPDEGLADQVYSGVPAGRFGARQVIEVGPMSGRVNVVHWLSSHGLEATPGRVARLLDVAKRSDHVLTDVELLLALEMVGSS